MAKQVQRDDHQTVKTWLLILVGLLMLAGVGYLEYRNATVSQSTEMVTSGSKNDPTVVTKKTGNPVSDTLLSTGAGFGAALLIAGAFFGRLAKLLLPGGIELDFDTEAAIGAKSSQATKGDASKTKKVAKEAIRKATALAQTGTGSADAQGYIRLSEAEINQIVLDAARVQGVEVDADARQEIGRSLI